MPNPSPQTAFSQSASPKSVPALVTFWLLLIWSGMVGGVFLIIFHDPAITVNTATFGLLTSIFSIESTLLVGAVGFWIGSSIGAKASGDAMADSNKTAQAALSKLAGAPPDAPAPAVAVPPLPTMPAATAAVAGTPATGKPDDPIHTVEDAKP